MTCMSGMLIENFIRATYTMKNSLLKIFFIATASLYVNIALSLADSSDITDELNKENVEDRQAVQEYSNNTITIFIGDKDRDGFEEDAGYQDVSALLRALNNEDMSDEILQEQMESEPVEEYHNILRQAPPRIIHRVTPRPRSAPTTQKNNLSPARVWPKTKIVATTKPPPTSWSDSKNKAHLRRIKEVSEHMEHNFMSTLYLYQEVERIRKTRVILNELRLMAADLEHPNHVSIKQEVMRCYKVYRPKKETPFWIYATNNLIINHVFDPDNHGVHN